MCWDQHARRCIDVRAREESERRKVGPHARAGWADGHIVSARRQIQTVDNVESYTYCHQPIANASRALRSASSYPSQLRMVSLDGLGAELRAAGPSVTIDISAFPTIVEDILSLAIEGVFHDPETAPLLYALRLVSRAVKDTIDTRLARHISLDLTVKVIYDAEFLAEVNALRAKPHLLLRGEEEPEFYRDRHGHERRVIVAIHRGPRIHTKTVDEATGQPIACRPAQRIPGMRWGEGATAADVAECLRRLRDTHVVDTTSDATDYYPPMFRDRMLLHALLDHPTIERAASKCPSLGLPTAVWQFDKEKHEHPDNWHLRVLTSGLRQGTTTLVACFPPGTNYRPDVRPTIVLPATDDTLESITIHVQVAEGFSSRLSGSLQTSLDGVLHSIAARLDLHWTLVTHPVLDTVDIRYYDPGSGSTPERIRLAIYDHVREEEYLWRHWADDGDLAAAVERVRVVTADEYRDEVGSERYRVEAEE